MARDATTQLDGELPSIRVQEGEPTRSERAAREPPRPGAGATVSRYLVIEELGRGGMGVVLRAYDPKLHREVALKIVGAISKDGHARLLREARALAQINHPNVVAVYDVEDEREYGVVLSMELVEGVSLDRWLKSEPHAWTEVLPRFLAAGQGLAAAHRKALLHRDFKPGNVLIGTDGRVRVTDFGLARAARRDDPSDDLRSATRDGGLDENVTRTGLVMGTPAYMAPEQHDDRELTPATDQYAYCVALWEALARQRPFAGPTIALDKLRGAPPWPAGVDVPRAIVDAIARGLSPRAEDRFASMDALLAALAAATRRRNRWPAVGIGAVAIAAIAGGFALADDDAKPCADAATRLNGIWDAPRRARVEDAFARSGLTFAPDVWSRTAPTLDAWAQSWIEMYTDACEATAIRGEQSAEVLDLRMACLQQARADLKTTTELLVAADRETIDRAHVLVGGLPRLSACADVAALQSGVPPPPPEHAEAVDAADVRLAEAHALLRAGRYDDAGRILDEVRASASSLSYAPLTIRLDLRQGQLDGLRGRSDDAERTYESLLERALAHPDTASRTAAIELVRITTRRRRYDEALVWATVARGLLGDERGGPLESELLDAEAELHAERGDLAEAERCYAEAVAILESMPTPDEADIAALLGNAARVPAQRGQLDIARAQVEHAAARLERAIGPEHPAMAVVLCNLAMLEIQTERPAEAKDFASRAIRLESATIDERSPERLRCLHVLGAAHMQLEEHDAAIEVLQQALEIADATLEPDNPTIGLLLTTLGDAQVEGDLDAAEASARRAIAIYEATLGPGNAELGFPLFTLGRVLRLQGRLADAIDVLQRGVDLRQQSEVPGYLLGASQFELALALWAAGRDRDRATALAIEARRQLAAFDKHLNVAEIDAWLASPDHGSGR